MDTRELIRRLYESADRIADMASTGRQVRMSIPVDAQRDDDVFIATACREAAAALEAAQADAERYRWLRDNPRGRALSMSALEWRAEHALADAAIDAARASVQGSAE